MSLDLPSKSTFVHLTLVPYINVSGELKTKPTQLSERAEFLALALTVLFVDRNRTSQR